MSNTYCTAIPQHTSSSLDLKAILKDGEISEEALGKILEGNLKLYEVYAETAGNNNADILVYPEFGLLPFNFPLILDKKHIYPICDTIPVDPNHITPEHKILYPASTWAKNNGLYIVINLSTLHGDDIYVTDVVFDRTGKIIAVYDKFHIFFKNLFSPPENYEVVTFETDFDVEFGLIICKDILGKQPLSSLKEKGIKHCPYCAAEDCFGPLIAWGWSLISQVTVLSGNLGDYVSIFQNGVEKKKGIWEKVYIGDVEKSPKSTFRADKSFPAFPFIG
jgi:hypothetical protein